MKKGALVFVFLVVFSWLFFPTAGNAQISGPGSGPPSSAIPPAPTPPPAFTPPPASPPPPAASGPGYEGSAPGPVPGPQAKCREWRMIERHMEYKFDQSTGKYREAPLEKWDWVDVPCGPNPSPAPPAAVGVPPSAPPEYAFPAPPQVAAIPGTYVYVVPDIDVDILFYHGYWYRPYGGRWYWAQSYNGPWVYLALPSVPRVLLGLPPGYRRLPPGYHRIPYGELHANWGRWERERYWHNDRAWREGWRRP